MSNVVLKVSNLTKVFGERVAVNNVSFEVHEGEIFGFLGPNGAGKTTTMRMIFGLTNITSGSVTICGYSVQNEFEKAMAVTGGIIETPLLYGYMSGYDNLKYYATLYKKIKKQNILDAAKVVGLENRIKDKVKKYSLGMRQRLGIAQALLHNPKLLILDEPLSGLDPNGNKELRDFLKHIAKEYKIAILISSHNLSDMEQLCDTIGIINNGTLVEIKSVEKIKEGIAKGAKIRFKVDYPNFAGKIVLNLFRVKVDVAGNSIIVHAGKDKINEISKALISNNISIFGVETINKNLEELFLDIIKKKSNGITSIM